MDIGKVIANPEIMDLVKMRLIGEESMCNRFLIFLHTILDFIL